MGGLTVDGNGHLGGFGGTSTSVSAFGRTLAPPEPRTSTLGWLAGIVFGIIGVGLLIGGGTTAFDSHAKNGDAATLFGLGVILFFFAVPAIFSARSSDRYNSTIYPRLRRRWANFWVCYQCGQRFEPTPLIEEPQHPSHASDASPPRRGAAPPVAPPGYQRATVISFPDENQARPTGGQSAPSSRPR